MSSRSPVQFHPQTFRPSRHTFSWLLLAAMCFALVWLSACAAAPAIPTIPTPVVTRTVTPTATPTFYTVEKGDTILGIAQKFGVDGQTLIEVNEIDDVTLLQPGQQLLISDRVRVSGTALPTATPTPEPCIEGCKTPVAPCEIKAFRARLDGTQMYVLPEDELYARVPAELWFCQESRARQAGWVHWTAFGPEQPTATPTLTPTPLPPLPATPPTAAGMN